MTFKYTGSNAYPQPKVSKCKFNYSFFSLCIILLIPPEYLFKFFIFLKCNPLPEYVCLVLVALYKYFYFVVNPFNLYIQFLSNPQEDLIIISAAHVCFPLEQSSGEEAIPCHNPRPLFIVFSFSTRNYIENLKSLPTHQFYKVPI